MAPSVYESLAGEEKRENVKKNEDIVWKTNFDKDKHTGLDPEQLSSHLYSGWRESLKQNLSNYLKQTRHIDDTRKEFAESLVKLIDQSPPVETSEIFNKLKKGKFSSRGGPFGLGEKSFLAALIKKAKNEYLNSLQLIADFSKPTHASEVIRIQKDLITALHEQISEQEKMVESQEQKQHEAIQFLNTQLEENAQTIHEQNNRAKAQEQRYLTTVKTLSLQMEKNEETIRRQAEEIDQLKTKPLEQPKAPEPSPSTAPVNQSATPVGVTQQEFDKVVTQYSQNIETMTNEKHSLKAELKRADDQVHQLEAKVEELTKAGKKKDDIISNRKQITGLLYDWIRAAYGKEISNSELLKGIQDPKSDINKMPRMKEIAAERDKLQQNNDQLRAENQQLREENTGLKTKFKSFVAAIQKLFGKDAPKLIENGEFDKQAASKALERKESMFGSIPTFSKKQ